MVAQKKLTAARLELTLWAKKLDFVQKHLVFKRYLQFLPTYQITVPKQKKLLHHFVLPKLVMKKTN